MRVSYRADHVGSLLRPAELLEARTKVAVDKDKLREIEDREILRVLGKQKELGFDIFTDGELRRSTFMSDLTDAVEGFDVTSSVVRTWQIVNPALSPSPPRILARLPQFLHEDTRFADCSSVAEEFTLMPNVFRRTMEGVTALWQLTSRPRRRGRGWAPCPVCG